MIFVLELDADAASNLTDRHDYERALALIDELFDWYRSLRNRSPEFDGQQNGAKHIEPRRSHHEILGSSASRVVGNLPLCCSATLFPELKNGSERIYQRLSGAADVTLYLVVIQKCFSSWQTIQSSFVF